jgi:hypothetical protein
MAQYRGGVIGLGWMGLLTDIAMEYDRGEYSVDDVDRPTPPLDVHRTFHHHQHPGTERIHQSYSEALWDRPEIDLVAGCDRDIKRVKAFGERYGLDALYTDAAEMLRNERIDVLAIPSNVKGRADLTCLAVEHGVKAIFTEKPMCHTLEEADRMVKACADADVPLNCGAITTTHPAFAKAKELLQSGAIGELVSIEASGPGAQHQNWSFFIDSPPAWVIGHGDDTGPREGGSTEFSGQGMMVTQDGRGVHFRRGAPLIRLTGTTGEMLHDWSPVRWKLFLKLPDQPSHCRVEAPWPGPQIIGLYGSFYSLDDIMACLAGDLDEPKNSGRRVAVALEVEIALKLSSANGGRRVDLPLADRSLGLQYGRLR